MNSIDQLRVTINDRTDGWLKIDLYKHADEIEKEIERDYISRPVDVGGDALEIGDELRFQGKTVLLNSFVWDGSDWYATDVITSSGWYPTSLCNRKPDSLKELISEAALEIIDVGYQSVPTIGNVPKISVDEDRLDEWLEANAERIREMIGGSE